jgi:hypothetical protein
LKIKERLAEDWANDSTNFCTKHFMSANGKRHDKLIEQQTFGKKFEQSNEGLSQH